MVCLIYTDVCFRTKLTCNARGFNLQHELSLPTTTTMCVWAPVRAIRPPIATISATRANGNCKDYHSCSERYCWQHITFSTGGCNRHLSYVWYEHCSVPSAAQPRAAKCSAKAAGSSNFTYRMGTGRACSTKTKVAATHFITQFSAFSNGNVL
jgi:hypothetical protein